jgi:hypothetical protein
MNILDEFIGYLQEQVANRSIYVWGGQGEKAPTITEAWIRKQDTSEANALRSIAYWRKQVAAGYGDKLRAFDCSGLALYWLQNLKGIYKSDMTADGLYRTKCGQKLRRDEVRRGDWCFIQSAAGTMSHIGYIVDDAGTVIEAQGRDVGVVQSNISGRTAAGGFRWTHFARPDVFAPFIEVGRPGPVVLAITQPLMRSDGILKLQEALNAMGYDCGDPDGSCGKSTMAGVKAFVAAHKEDTP